VPGKVKVIRLPARAQPNVLYGICIVSRSANKPSAQAFVTRLLARQAQAKLVAAGFLPRVKKK
jgi:ABC-type molybdate transport system substrate-binding protein